MITPPIVEAARRHPARPALIEGDRTLNYAQLLASAAGAAHALGAAGARAGEPVAVWAPNSLDWAIAMHGASWLGAPLLPLPPRWTDAEAASLLERLKPRLVVGDAEGARRAAALGHRAMSFEALALPATGSLPAGWPEAHPVAMVPTSGTTGRPKAARVSWGQLETNARGVGEVLALGPEDRWWLAMPFHHVGGLAGLWRCARFGAAAVIAGRFDPARALDEFETHGVTVASVVPTMLQAIEEARGDRPWPPCLRALMLGGAAAPPGLVARVPLALPTYGLTEAGSTVTLVPPGADEATRLTSGWPIPGAKVRIEDEAGRPLPPGAEGLVAVAGPMVTSGYEGDAAASEAALRDGWLLTGDHGRIDAAGRLTVLSRRADMIVSGGENLYPAEIEAALLAHPAIAACAVVPTSDAHWGQTPFAWLVLREPVSPEDLASWLTGRLARFKQPRRWGVLETLPLLSNGKIDRQALTRLAAQGEFELH
ncbi:MAG: class I adenylate-forming enzyme family protein [Candidatus Sericytochromatia bacterium]